MGELLQTVERYLPHASLSFLERNTADLLSQFEGNSRNGLSVTDLVNLENQLQTALKQARSRKVTPSFFLRFTSLFYVALFRTLVLNYTEEHQLCPLYFIKVTT